MSDSMQADGQGKKRDIARISLVIIESAVTNDSIDSSTDKLAIGQLDRIVVNDSHTLLDRSETSCVRDERNSDGVSYSNFTADLKPWDWRGG